MGRKIKEAEKKIIRPDKGINAEKADALNKKLFKTTNHNICELKLDF